MLTIEQCRSCAAAYKILGKDLDNSARKSSVLASISRSWIALAHQLEASSLILNEEEKVRPPQLAARPRVTLLRRSPASPSVYAVAAEVWGFSRRGFSR